jgi:Tfp pilus assembly protein PilF
MLAMIPGRAMPTPEISRESRPRSPVKFTAAFLLLGTLAIFARACSNDFVNCDDPDYVTENEHVQSGLTATSVAWAFTTTRSSNWHPLTWLSLELDQQLYGTAPWGYHLTNVLLHTANAVLLFLALLRMTHAVWRSAMLAALFAVHPLHVESVAWVSERKDVLSTLFWMLSLLAYARYAERPRLGPYLLVMTFMALGLLAKPMLVTLPCVLLLLDYWPLERMAGGWWRVAGKDGSSPASHHPSRATLLLEKLPLFVLSAASSAVTLFAQQQAITPVAALPLHFRLVNALMAYATYLGKMLWPERLAVLYPYPRAWPVIDVVLVATLLLAISVWALWSARRRPYLIVGWLWYVGTLVPVIGLVQVGQQSMADRYTYVPLVGIFLMLVWRTAEVFENSPRRQLVLVPLSAMVLIVCAVLSVIQIGYWHDPPRLWERALAATSDNAQAQFQVGLVREHQGKAQEAAEHYRVALQIAPDHAQAHLGFGRILLQQGQQDAAMPHLLAATSLNPALGNAHQALGLALAAQGKLDEARTQFLMALDTAPRDVTGRCNLGVILMKQGKLDEATEQFMAALAIDPESALAHNNLGAILLQRQEAAAALEHFSAGLRSNPGDASAHYNCGLALESLGRSREAMDEYRAALRIRPHPRAQEHLDALEREQKP